LRIYYNYREYSVSKPVITIGAFDGVHKGHVEILKRVNAIANKVGGESVVLTFWPHPRMVLKQDNEIKLINSLKEKEKFLEQNGIQHLVILSFTEEFSHLSSADFVKKILVDALNVKYLVVGYNHHFGHDREGNFDSIQQFAVKYQFSVEKLDAQLVENEKVSSTLIRKALSNGDMESATKYLGYSYQLSGPIIGGKKIGSDIGFPTANLKVEPEYKIIPCPGVYAALAEVDRNVYSAMVNIGFNPTIESNPHNLSIEAHIIDFSGDIYGKEITLYFKKRIREEIKFSGLEELKKQLGKDKTETINIINSLK
jgi:riboflavin kinase / FMN adenylyltransferase